MRIKLSQSYVDNLPPVPDDRTKIERCDTSLPGLLLEQRQANSEWASYRLRYKNPAGKTSYITIGRSCDITLQEARIKARRLKADIQANEADPQAEVREHRKVITVREYATEHYLPWAKVRKRSWRNDKSLLNLRILPAIGDIPLNKVTRRQIELLHNSVLEEGLSGAQADHVLKCTRFLYTKSIEHGFCEENPASGIKQFNFDNRIERYLSDEELTRLMAVLDRDKNQMVCNVIRMLLATGMRLGECLASAWSSVDRKNRTLTIQAAYAKSRKRRVIPLNDMAMDVLDSLNTEGRYEHLFVSSRTGRRLKGIRKVFERIMKEAEIEGFRIHDLRHSFCSYALQQGRSIAEVAQLAGHSNVQITMSRYAHFAKGQLHEASNSASDHIASVTTPTDLTSDENAA